MQRNILKLQWVASFFFQKHCFLWKLFLHRFNFLFVEGKFAKRRTKRTKTLVVLVTAQLRKSVPQKKAVVLLQSVFSRFTQPCRQPWQQRWGAWGEKLSRLLGGVFLVLWSVCGTRNPTKWTEDELLINQKCILRKGKVGLIGAERRQKRTNSKRERLFVCCWNVNVVFYFVCFNCILRYPYRFGPVFITLLNDVSPK
jgi:hypothetical protein